MTDAGREADSSVPPEPRAPRLPPRWVRRIVIGGAVTISLLGAIPALVRLLSRRPGTGATPEASLSLGIVAEEFLREGEAEPKPKRRKGNSNDV